jgi:hypothetical protein
MYNITNNSVNNDHLEQFEHICAKFIPYAKERLGFDKPIDVEMVSDPENAKDPFGKTAYYDPNMMKITLFVDKRHIKDILRSLSHELVHHAQNCRGDLTPGMHTGPGYAQKDQKLRDLEGEAYKMGNGYVFRDFEDQYKQLAENLDHFLNLIKDERKSDIYLLRQNVAKENIDMSTRIKILKENLSLQHEGSCAKVHKGKTHEEYQQLQGIMMTEEELEEDETVDEQKELEEQSPIPYTPGKSAEERMDRGGKKEEKPKSDPKAKPKKTAVQQAQERVTRAKKKLAKDPENDSLKKRLASAVAALKRAKKEAGHPTKTDENLNENWTKGNKDQLLFESLMEKWIK